MEWLKRRGGAQQRMIKECGESGCYRSWRIKLRGNGKNEMEGL